MHSKRAIVTARSEERRYNLPKIARQVISGGWLLTLGLVSALTIWGPRGPVDPLTVTWAQRFTFFVADNPIGVAAMFMGAIAAFTLICVWMLQRRSARD